MSASAPPAEPTAPRDEAEGVATWPDRIGRYRLLLPIGTGGMATVYLGRASGVGGFERDVALKVLHPHLVAQKAARAEFLEEAKLAASIRHPNCVPVIDVGDDPLGVFLVMEYVEGDSLAGLLGTLPSGSWVARPVALRILVDALAGLHGAHELRDESGAPAGLVHRDFSPQNILVGADGVTRLTDFGIAKAKSRAGHTAPGLVKGKLRYMAPEQAQGGAFDRRCDVWAAGVVAWELCAGRRLYESDDEVQTLLAILSSDPPRLRSIDPSIPRALEDAVARALVRDATQRCGSADELRRLVLEAAAQGGGIAEPAEVAAFVAAAAGEALAERRARAERARRERPAAASRTAPRAEAAPASDGPSFVERTATSAVASATAAPRPAPKRRSAAAIAAAAAGATAIVAWAVFARGPASPDGHAVGEVSAPTPGAGSIAASAPASAASAPASATSATSAPASAVPAVAPTDAPIADALHVEADAPVTQVRIGARVVSIAPAATAVTIQLLPAERDAARSLDLRAVDGRRVAVVVPAASSSVAVSFPAAGPQHKLGKSPETGRHPPAAPPLPRSPYEH